MSEQVDEVQALYGGPPTRRVRTRDLIAAKERGDRWPMLTSYDQYTAAIFDASGVPVLLVGDSAANNVFGPIIEAFEREGITFYKKLSAANVESGSDLVTQFELALRVLANPLDRLHVAMLAKKWAQMV